MLPGQFAKLLQNFPTTLCQMERIQTPVIRVLSSLHESPFLKIVQDRHQPAGMNLQLCCEFLLAQAGRNAQESQDSGVWRREVKNSQSFSKLRRGMGSKLGNQEGRLSFFHLVVIHI